MKQNQINIWMIQKKPQSKSSSLQFPLELQVDIVVL